MATLNLTKVGGLVLVEYTGRNDRIISASNPALEIDMPADGTSKVGVTLAGRSYSLSVITDIQIAGEAVTNQSDLLTKIATVFPEANGGAGGPTPTIDAVLAVDDTAIAKKIQLNVADTEPAIEVRDLAGEETKVKIGIDAEGEGFIEVNGVRIPMNLDALLAAGATLTENRDVVMNGNALSVKQGVNNFLSLDPTADSESVRLQAFNVTDDGNAGGMTGNVNNIQAAADLFAIFNDGVKSASLQASANETESTFVHNADTHTFNGAVKVNDKAVAVVEYLKYTAILNQTGTGAPTVVAILGANTIGDIVWAYNDVGQYSGTLAGAFIANRTICPDPITISGDFLINKSARFNDDVVFLLMTNGTSGVDADGDFFVEIRVYPA